jgi:ribosomal protein S12 methylthiotransferase accessory factor
MIRSAVPVPPIAQAYMDALPAGEWFLFDMSPLDRTGIPAWKAVLFPDDPRAAGCEMQHGTGYGETDDRAIVAAVAEAHEEVHARLGFARMRQVEGSYDQLVRTRGRGGVADPLELCLPAGSPVGRDTPLRWVEARRWTSGEPVLVPADLAALSRDALPAGYEPFTTLITNGLGAGPTRGWAAAHGLFECLQRDGNGLFFRALDPGVGLTFAEPLPAEVQAIMDRMTAAGVELMPKFATDEWGLVNLFVVGPDRDPAASPIPIAMTGGGEACDVDRVAALRKAVLECAHSRARKAFTFGPLELVRAVMPDGYWERVEPRTRRSARDAEPRQVEAFRRWLQLDGERLHDLLLDPVFSCKSERAFETLATSGIDGTEAKGEEAARRLVAGGLDPLVLDWTDADAPMHSARVIVPRLEVETMSYYRVGERGAAKLIAQDSPLIRFRQETETLRPVRLSAEAYDRLGGVPLFDTAEAERRVGGLYPLYREPGSHEMMFQGEPVAA